MNDFTEHGSNDRYTGQAGTPDALPAAGPLVLELRT